MYKIDGWLAASTQKARPKYRSEINRDRLVGMTEANAEAHLKDLISPDTKLRLWHRTSTTLVAAHETPTKAAILPKSLAAHSDLPRVEGWKKILMQIAKETGCRDVAFVADFLLDIEFQHHQSTNGRWNSELERWERYAVRSVEDWCKSGINNAKERRDAPKRVSERTLRNIKTKLEAAGLIDARTHLWNGDNHLWIKPSDKLSRMLFEEGHSQSTQQSPEPAPKVKKLRPRGMSAKHAKVEEENRELYRQAITGQLNGLDKKMLWLVWDRLTKPYAITDNIMKAPYAADGSSRRKRLYAALGLTHV
ncbi:hypothetical protein ASG39_11270 [Rhizobium sp. Leaf371]|uniref:hypothetical protein n=1 Tax=Rhizobium sp. Leaf371 TaxID=1736355 RepID=UPI000712F572|nr:hypothetical protein [Rhizobium sp. Leaf371]KQS64527.1 hypothetical protein ASG39_11270 [Rhizobium sp. Leaf371]